MRMLVVSEERGTREREVLDYLSNMLGIAMNSCGALGGGFSWPWRSRRRIERMKLNLRSQMSRVMTSEQYLSSQRGQAGDHLVAENQIAAVDGTDGENHATRTWLSCQIELRPDESLMLWDQVRRTCGGWTKKDERLGWVTKPLMSPDAG